MAKGLQKGARILRRWRKFSNLRLVHPVKFCVVVLLLVPNLAIILSLYYLGRFCSWLSRCENAGERYAEWWGRFAETAREHDLRIRAWFGKRKKGGAS